MTPSFATLASDGWALLDAERAYLRRDGVYWVPPPAERRGIPPGVLAKLVFVWEDPAPDEPGRERMWVEVEREESGAYLGKLANEPHADAPISEGAPVWFRPEHVVDLCVPGGRPLTEKSELVHCGSHGWSEPCFVCIHVYEGTGRGFNEPREPGRLRPDAWCDACDALVAGKASWEAAETEPPIRLVCGACYDRIRERNRRAPA